MGVSPVKKCLLGIPTALAVASLLNANPVLAQTRSDRDSGLFQTEPENAQPILAQRHLNEDSIVRIEPEQLLISFPVASESLSSPRGNPTPYPSPSDGEGRRREGIRGKTNNSDANGFDITALIEAEIELLESQKFSYKAADLLPDGNSTGSILPTNPTNPTLNSQGIAQSERPLSNSIVPQRWYVQAEALFLNRTIPRGILTSEVVDLSVAETGSPERGDTLRTDDVAFDYELGTRITVGYSRNRKDSISFSFFGLQEYSSSATLLSPEQGLPSDVVVEVPTDDTPILDPSESLGDKINILNQEPPLGQGNGSFAISQAFLLSYEHQLDYSANLYNFEWNYQREVASSNNFRPSWLVGVRYISAPEKFNLATFGAAAFPEQGLRPYPTGDYNIETRNNLFGFQIGGNANIGVSRNFSIGLGAKAGVFANNGDQTSIISAYDFDTGELLERIKGVKSEWGLSPVVEGSISANWQVSPNVSLTAGFNLVYLSGLALAPRQFRDFAESGEFGRLDMNGDTLYYGPSVGIRVVF